MGRTFERGCQKRKRGNSSLSSKYRNYKELTVISLQWAERDLVLRIINQAQSYHGQLPLLVISG